MRSKFDQQLDISSTQIRNLILAGAFTEAARLIGNDAGAAVTLFCFVEHERKQRRNEQRTREATTQRQESLRETQERQRRLRLSLSFGIALIVAVTAILIGSLI